MHVVDYSAVFLAWVSKSRASRRAFDNCFDGFCVHGSVWGLLCREAVQNFWSCLMERQCMFDFNIVPWNCVSYFLCFELLADI